MNRIARIIIWMVVINAVIGLIKSSQAQAKQSAVPETEAPRDA